MKNQAIMPDFQFFIKPKKSRKSDSCLFMLYSFSKASVTVVISHTSAGP